jgi:uncharacterized membrane protein YesL
MRRDPNLLIEVGIGLGVITLASVPALSAFISQVRHPIFKKETYEDQDGRSTAEALAAFSNKWAKAGVLLSAGVGLGCQIAVSVLWALHFDTTGIFLENWLTTACSVCNKRPDGVLDMLTSSL